jgi:hypothetical protein
MGACAIVLISCGTNFVRNGRKRIAQKDVSLVNIKVSHQKHVGKDVLMQTF